MTEPTPAPAPAPSTIPQDAASLARLTGLPVVGIEPVTVGLSNRTDVATLQDGRLVVVQRLADAALARHRVEVARDLGARLRPAGVPVPELLATDPAAHPPFIVTAHVPGRPGSASLDDPREAMALGADMGRLHRAIASVATDGLRLPGAWARHADLARVAGHWLARTSGLLPAATRHRLADSIAVFPAAWTGRPVVLAHGDWAPVNVLVERGSVSGVVDWEFARLADPLFDPAWWNALVWTFHPSAWPHAWPSFAEAAGIGDDGATLDRLGVLGSLRMLEVLGSARVLRDRRAARSWAERLVRVLDGRC